MKILSYKVWVHHLSTNFIRNPQEFNKTLGFDWIAGFCQDTTVSTWNAGAWRQTSCVACQWDYPKHVLYGQALGEQGATCFHREPKIFHPVACARGSRFARGMVTNSDKHVSIICPTVTRPGIIINAVTVTVTMFIYSSILIHRDVIENKKHILAGRRWPLGCHRLGHVHVRVQLS